MKVDLTKLMPVPIILFLFSIAVFVYNQYKYGDFILKDIDLKGGTLITIESNQPINTNQLQDYLAKKFSPVSVSGLATSTGFGANVEVGSKVNTSLVIQEIKNFGIQMKSFSVETIGPELGSMFFWQVSELLIAAYILMSIVIYVVYRNFISSFGIVFASLANILTTLALTSLLGIRVSFAGFAGLLMLIAYTVDTNIVLTTKVLHATPEKFYKEYKIALITGLTLIATVTTTMIITQFVSTSHLLVNIAQILSVGFVNDLAYTWILNAGLLEIMVRKRR